MQGTTYALPCGYGTDSEGLGECMVVSHHLEPALRLVAKSHLRWLVCEELPQHAFDLPSLVAIDAFTTVVHWASGAPSETA